MVLLNVIITTNQCFDIKCDGIICTGKILQYYKFYNMPTFEQSKEERSKEKKKMSQNSLHDDDRLNQHYLLTGHETLRD